MTPLSLISIHYSLKANILALISSERFIERTNNKFRFIIIWIQEFVNTLI